MDGLTYESIRNETDGANYPRALLAECEDALILFAAAFYGRQDAFWVSEAGLRASCVDVDEEKLTAMSRVYPRSWEWWYGDAYEAATAAHEAGVTYDLVSLDPKGADFERVALLTYLWCALARKYVVMGSGTRTLLPWTPEGWRVATVMRRSSYMGGTYWTVLERA